MADSAMPARRSGDPLDGGGVVVMAPLPLPHPHQPRSTAKRGTRRMHTPLRRLVENALDRPSAEAALAGGLVSSDRAKVVWQVNNRAVTQPLSKWLIPPGRDLQPVRRIGTYRDAPNRIGMYPIIRDGYALHLCLESRLEMGWVRALDIDPRVTWMHAQPFILIWTFNGKSLWRVPDLLVIRDGNPVVFDVKPRALLAKDSFTRAVLALTKVTLGNSGVQHEDLGDLTRQKMANLRAITRYKRVNPHLAADIQRVLDSPPATIGGLLLRTTDDHWGREVLMTLLASGVCRTDLDQPLHRATPLQWSTDSQGSAA